MKRHSLIVVCVLYLSIGCIAVRAQEKRVGVLSFEPYILRTFDGTEHKAELGRLWVRENRSNNSNRLIQLAFVRLHSTATQPGPPIVFIAGGPGVPGTSMGQIPVYFRLFDRLREVSDVILLDQRGTGLSKPGLQCPTPDVSAPPNVLASKAKAAHQIRKATEACTTRLRAQGIELAAYNVNAVTDDIDELRRALGANKLNLIGMSFGTQIALAIVRRHGDHVNRVVLAGTQGPDDNLVSPLTFDLLLKKLSRLAAEDAAINKSVPDFEALVKQVLEQLDKKPVTLTVKDRRSNHPVSVLVGKVALQVLLQGMSDGRAVPSLPAFFYTISRGDYSLLTSRVEGLYNSLGGSGNSAMSVAMSCSAGYSPERFARVQTEARQSLIGDVINLQLTSEICKLVDNPDLGAQYRARIWSTVPALFLSGTLDAVTPPYQAEEVRYGFPNSVHLVVENAGHETLPFREVQSIVLDFFKGQEVIGRTVSLPRPEFTSIEDSKKR